MASIDVILTQQPVYVVESNVQPLVYEVELAPKTAIQDVEIIKPLLFSMAMIDDSLPSPIKAFSGQHTTDLLATKSDTTHNHDLTYEAKNANIQAHIADITTNPHGVTATDVGAYTTLQTDTLLLGKSDATHSHNLDDLLDVVITTPSSGEALKYVAGTGWVNGNVGATVALNDITDVTITTPTTDQVLKYVAGTGWVNGVDAGGAQKLPIFSTESATLRPLSDGEEFLAPFANSYGSTLSYNVDVCYASIIGLYVAFSLQSTTNYLTSTDGKTWIERTSLPSSVVWAIGTNGTNLFMATASATTTVYTSSDGITWTISTALPGISASLKNRPIYYNGTWCVLSGVISTTLYYSTDNGNTWNSTTLSASPAGRTLSTYSGGFYYLSSNTTAHISTNATTWTSVNLPSATSSNTTTCTVLQDGSICFAGLSGSAIYKTNDFITFTYLANNYYNNTSLSIVNINGTYMSFSSLTSYSALALFHIINGKSYVSTKSFYMPLTLAYGVKWVNGILFVGVYPLINNETTYRFVSIDPAEIATKSLNAYYGAV